MGLSLNACVLLSCYVLTMHCGSSLVLSPSFYRFHEKWPYQAKNCHPQKERKIPSPTTPASYKQFFKL